MRAAHLDAAQANGAPRLPRRGRRRRPRPAARHPPGAFLARAPRRACARGPAAGAVPGTPDSGRCSAARGPGERGARPRRAAVRRPRVRGASRGGRSRRGARDLPRRAPRRVLRRWDVERARGMDRGRAGTAQTSGVRGQLVGRGRSRAMSRRICGGDLGPPRGGAGARRRDIRPAVYRAPRQVRGSCRRAACRRRVRATHGRRSSAPSHPWRLGRLVAAIRTRGARGGVSGVDALRERPRRR